MNCWGRISKQNHFYVCKLSNTINTHTIWVILIMRPTWWLAFVDTPSITPAYYSSMGKCSQKWWFIGMWRYWFYFCKLPIFTLKRSNSPYLMQNMREKHCHYGYSLHHCLNKIKNFSKQTHTQHYSSKTGFQFLTIRLYNMKYYKCRRHIQVYNKQNLPLNHQIHHRKLDPGCVKLH